MANRRLSYTLRPDTTPDAEADALARVYAFVLQKDPERENRDEKGRAPWRARPDKPPTARRSE